MKACSGTLWVYKILFITEFQQELSNDVLEVIKYLDQLDDSDTDSDVFYTRQLRNKINNTSSTYLGTSSTSWKDVSFGVTRYKNRLSPVVVLMTASILYKILNLVKIT